MYVLGICAYHGDCSATLIKDGRILVAVEEERFRRVKHWAGFPERSIRHCVEREGISLAGVDAIAVGRNPNANLLRKLIFLAGNRQTMKKLRGRVAHRSSVNALPRCLGEGFGLSRGIVAKKTRFVEHHVAHMASAFLVSPFQEAAIMSLDGFGDFVSGMFGRGRAGEMEVLRRVIYPHSLGLFYSMVTQFLGFWSYGDEYKVMGLSSFGAPTLKEELSRVISYVRERGYRLDLSYFRHQREGANMTWENGEPTMGPLFSERFVREFGPPRGQDDEITDFHRDLAASLQAHTEEIIFSLLNDLHKMTRCRNLCLAGGVALNSVANGKIFDRTPFREVFIQPAAGDAGTSMGAAYFVWQALSRRPREFVMETAHWGPEFSPTEIDRAIQGIQEELLRAECVRERVDDGEDLCGRTARIIAEGNVVGWFQGRMEWGPRALGNRSIIADPRRGEMVDLLNARIKRRESFRPFAPSILLERTGEYFENDYPDPFMLKVYPVRPEKRHVIPAVTHVDGTGRLQTVRREENPRYYGLIKAFEGITGVPVVLNTSFNENEPIVCRPEEALDCFLRTKMDALVLGNHIIKKPTAVLR